MMTPVSTTTPADLLVFLVLVAGATYRLTVLVIRDTITAPFRDWVTRRYGGPLVIAFTRCPWCVSVWIAAGLTAAGWAWWLPIQWFPAVLIAASAAAFTGVMFEKV